MDSSDVDLTLPQRDEGGLSPPAEYHKLVSLTNEESSTEKVALGCLPTSALGVR